MKQNLAGTHWSRFTTFLQINNICMSLTIYLRQTAKWFPALLNNFNSLNTVSIVSGFFWKLAAIWLQKIVANSGKWSRSCDNYGWSNCDDCGCSCSSCDFVQQLWKCSLYACHSFVNFACRYRTSIMVV